MARKFSKDNRWRRSVTDPVLFCREFLEIEPHPGQQRWLTNSDKGQNLLVTGNRWGKSLVQAIKMVHRAIFRIRDLEYDTARRYRLLSLAITQDQANIIFRNCLTLIKGKSLVELLVEKVTYTPFPRIEFGNGAEITARTSQNRGEYILGNDYDYINFDEVAFELHPEYIVDEILTMRLADRKGMLDLTSTPRGKNWFYQKYRQLAAQPAAAYVQQGRSTENPHLSGEFLQRKIETLPQARVNQNIYGMFVESGNEILAEQFIQQALAQATGLAARVAHHRYLHGWDLARKQTYTVGITLDVARKPYQLVRLERFQRRDWPAVYETIRKRQHEYGGETVIDSTGIGDVVVSHVDDIKPHGFIFTAQSKAELLTNLQSEFEAGNLGIPQVEQNTGEEYWSLSEELREVSWEQNNHCDAVMALALALWPLRPQAITKATPQFRIDSI
ncbi:MAG: hypothetical protein KAT58_03215 [candidate division Zixibacteria bacterium]|nr:hypothetical protein [candidate division Zixibacteria bacterium]